MGLPNVLEILPSVWLGDYESLTRLDHVKIIINCGDTIKFLNVLNDERIALSSDVIVLSFDPGFQRADLSGCENIVRPFEKQYNKILQGYLSHFYYNNQNRNLIHDLPFNLEVNSPILSGNIKDQFFILTRLIKLFRCLNQDSEVLIVGSENLSIGLGIAVLMDTYGLDVVSSMKRLISAKPDIGALNSRLYEDLLILESLKKFGVENDVIKRGNGGVLMSNCKLKRGGDEVEYVVVGKRPR